MKLTKYEHACVRLEKNGKTLVIDPGIFNPEDVAADADAVLISHEHFDHFQPDRIPSGAEVWACPAVAEQLPGAHAVQGGDSFETAGFRVAARGVWHAPNHPDLALVQNTGYLVDDDVFYPGDALTPPGADVGTLLLPSNAPWLRAFDAIQYLRAVRPARAFSTHDGLLNGRGLQIVDTWMGMEADRHKAEIRRLTPGESLDI